MMGAIYTGHQSLDYRNYYSLVIPGSPRVIGISAKGVVIQEPLKDAPDQQWGLIGVGDGYYKIVNRQRGLALDVGQASLQSGTPVLQYAYSDGQNQQRSLRQLKTVCSKSSSAIVDFSFLPAKTPLALA